MRANSISTLVFIFGLMSATIAYYAWRHRATRGSAIFSAFMAAISVYVLGYSMELASLDLSTMLFWSKVGYLGIFSFPSLFLIFVLQYTGRLKWLKTRYILLIFLFPTFLLLGKLTDDIFHLVYSTTWVDTSGIVPMLGFTRGPIYPLAIYAIFPMILGTFLLLQKQTNTTPLFQKQTTLIAASVLLPLLIFIIYMLKFQPLPALKYLDINVFMAPIWGVGIAWAMFRYRLLDLAPIARDAVIEHLREGVVVLDDRGRLVDANPAALSIFGWDKLPIGQNAGEVFPTSKVLGDTLLSPGMDDPVKLEIRSVLNGIKVSYDMTISTLHDEIGKILGRLVVIHDISERKQMEEQLRELSLVDELTGLSNRRGFNILANHFIDISSRMNLKAAIIFADLDWLKTINDSFGHAEGDQALIETANLLKRTFRSSDIIARLSGDEFVILASESCENSAEEVLSRFKARLEDFNSNPDRKYPLSISFGMAHYAPGQPKSLDELMQEADKAMYEEKLAKKESLND